MSCPQSGDRGGSAIERAVDPETRAQRRPRSPGRAEWRSSRRHALPLGAVGAMRDRAGRPRGANGRGKGEGAGAHAAPGAGSPQPSGSSGRFTALLRGRSTLDPPAGPPPASVPVSNVGLFTASGDRGAGPSPAVPCAAPHGTLVRCSRSRTDAASGRRAGAAGGASSARRSPVARRCAAMSCRTSGDRRRFGDRDQGVSGRSGEGQRAGRLDAP